MTIPLNFTISPDCIRVQVPGTDYDEEIPNMVAYDLETRLPVAFGISRETMAVENPDYLRAMQGRIGFTALFTPQSPPERLEAAVIEYYQALASDKRGPRWYNLAPLLTWYELTFRIQDYDTWTGQRRERFEYGLQARQRADRLQINGRELAIVSMAWVLTWIWASDHPAILIPALFIVPLLVAVLGIVAWMVSVRSSLPAGYLRYVARPRSFFRSIWDWLAERIIG
jgi:hypothetical protein